MVNLIIKGNSNQARKAAMARGIAITVKLEHNPVGSLIETIASTDSDLDAVGRWFCELTLGPAPFPIGTLLHYASA